MAAHRGLILFFLLFLLDFASPSGYHWRIRRELDDQIFQAYFH
jgi:hypothetical protein